MALVTVPRPLQEQLGEAATDSLVGMFEQLDAVRTEQQEAHKEQLFELLEERFLRHVAESEGRLRAEIVESEGRLRAEIAESEARLRAETAASITTSEARLRAEMQAGFDRQQEQLTRQQEQIGRLGKEIERVRSDLSRQIGDVHKQIAVQTRWILTVLGGAAVLFPIIQRLMAALLPT